MAVTAEQRKQLEDAAFYVQQDPKHFVDVLIKVFGTTTTGSGGGNPT